MNFRLRDTNPVPAQARLRRYSIGTKIFAAFIAMSAITAILGAGGHYFLTEAGKIVADTYDRPLMAINFARSASLDFMEMSKEKLKHDIAPPDKKAEIDKIIARLTSDFQKDLKVAEARSLGDKERAAIAQIKDLVGQWTAARDAGGAGTASGDAVDAIADKIIDRFDVLTELTADDSFIERRKAVSAIEDYTYIIYGMSLLALLLAATITLLLSRRIVRPLAAAARAANSISAGDLETPIPRGGKDEAGALLNSMHVMQDNLLRMMQDLVRAREAAESASVAKSQFLATMSHEIRTPMNGVLGMADLLASTKLTDSQRHLVDSVRRSGDALLAIINDVLDFSRIEAGRIELFAVPFDLREAIGELTELFSERCAEKNIEFVYFIAEDVPSKLVGDLVRIRQVLINLLGNAVKFTEQGEVLLEVSLYERRERDVVISLAVEDTGIGIAPDQRVRVFEAFHQADASMMRARGGSGLGLAITKQLVELMDGTITLQSEPGEGSRFTATLRIDLPPEGERKSAPPPRIARPLTVLLADAHPTSAHVIAMYLESWNVAFTQVSGIAEAEAAWRKAAENGTPFDVAILDGRGFGDQAFDLAGTIRNAETGAATYVVLLVGLDRLLAVESWRGRPDRVAVLTKPVRPSVLYDTLVEIAAGGEPQLRSARSEKADGSSMVPQFHARVLVAEDNPVNQEVAAGFLDALGCETVTAPNGRVAVQMFAQEKFDLVLMDCEMPVMDGLQATRRIREIETQPPAGSARRPHTPVVALTAHAMAEVRENCLKAGMDDFLVKPFQLRQLAEMLGKWLTQGEGGSAGPAAGASGPSARRVIDMAAIENLQALDRLKGGSRLERAVAQFLEIAPGLADAMRDGAAVGDGETVRQAAHSLKSSAGALGAVSLAEVCDKIEAAARASDLAAVRPLIPALVDELAAALAALQRVVEASKKDAAQS